METDRYKLFDDADWYFEEALSSYTDLNDKAENSLTDDDYRRIAGYAGNHIALFITWIVKHGFESDIFTDYEKGLEFLAALRDEKIAGTEFMLEMCDGKLDGEMLSDEIFPFVDHFYDDNYFGSFYAGWVVDELCDLPLETEWSWDDYRRFEKKLDEVYAGWIKNNG